jgi:hypothetical protein
MLIHEIGPQSYAKIGTDWYVRVPNARRAVKVDPEMHIVTEHEDGTITVTPSLVYKEPHEWDYWHGFLVRGKFLAC